MQLAGEMARPAPPLTARTTMAEASGRLAAGDPDVLPVVDDEARRRPAGFLSTAEVDACRTAGHDPNGCPVERHLRRDFVVALPEDRVEAVAEGGAAAVLVVGDDRRLQGIIPAQGGGLRVTPIPKAEPMVGGWGGMELVWRCGDCGYLIARPGSPPERCPDCGAPREHFVLLTED